MLKLYLVKQQYYYYYYYYHHHHHRSNNRLVPMCLVIAPVPRGPGWCMCDCGTAKPVASFALPAQ